MKRSTRGGWILVGLVLLAASGRGTAVAQEAKGDPRFQSIDLQPIANKGLDEDFHTRADNNLKPLPRGRQKFKDVEFVIGEKYIQLASTNVPDSPEKIEGIPVKRKLTRMHFLHAAGWGSPGMPDGTRIGSFEIHFDDKTSDTVPIEYGHDLRDWWDFDNATPVTRAVVAWKGANEASTNFQAGGVGIRLYQLSWTNPHPEKIVAGFDYVSNNETMCAPFLVAATTDYVQTLVPLNRDVPRHSAINARARQGNVDLIFIGDSITQGWEGNGKEIWTRRFEPRKAMNAGIGGDRTQHVLWRLDNGNVNAISPKLAMLMIGTNNFGGDSAEDIAAGIEAIVRKLRSKLPRTKVLLLGVFPRGELPDDPLRAKNVAVNALIKDTGASMGDSKVQYLSINDKLLRADGSQDRAVMPDLVHLSPKGYEIWADAIEPALAEALEGIVAFPKLPEQAGKIDKDAPRTFQETESGLKYRILRKSAGKSPAAADKVTVEYHGWLDDGKMFDTSYDRGEPTTFFLNAVIRGWTEGMQLVGEGGMIELVIPSQLGYGARGAPPTIPPDATLHFVVELLEVE